MDEPSTSALLMSRWNWLLQIQIDQMFFGLQKSESAKTYQHTTMGFCPIPPWQIPLFPLFNRAEPIVHGRNM